MTKTHKQTLIEANLAIAQNDHDGFLRFCTDDTEWTFVGDINIKGKEAVRQWMKTAYLEPPVFKVLRMIAEDDYVTAVGEIILKDATGKSTRYAYSDVWRFHEGKMAALHAFVVEAPLDSGAFE